MTRCFVLGVMLATTLSGAANAITIYESATMGAPGQTTGPGRNILFLSYLAVRFEVTTAVTTTEIGGHFDRIEPEHDTIFGAIVALTGPSDFPDSKLSTPDVLGTTLISLPETSADVSGALSVNLTPGWYGLVFGGGLFGASLGGGNATTNNVDIGSPSYFKWAFDTNWAPSSVTNTRFFVNGVPEPATALMLACGIAGFAIRRYR